VCVYLCFSLSVWIANCFAERLSFEQGGQLEVNFAAFIGERVPESDDERDTIGDAPFFAEMTFAEAVDPPVFSADRLSGRPATEMEMRLMKQFNSAVAANHPIEQFLGLFKILEDRYLASKSSQSMLRRLLANHELRQTALEILVHGESQQPIERSDADELIEKFVRIRHECAHLKTEINFGLQPDDPRIESELRPILPALEVIVREVVKRSSG